MKGFVQEIDNPSDFGYFNPIICRQLTVLSIGVPLFPEELCHQLGTNGIVLKHTVRC